MDTVKITQEGLLKVMLKHPRADVLVRPFSSNWTLLCLLLGEHWLEGASHSVSAWWRPSERRQQDFQKVNLPRVRGSPFFCSVSEEALVQAPFISTHASKTLSLQGGLCQSQPKASVGCYRGHTRCHTHAHTYIQMHTRT